MITLLCLRKAGEPPPHGIELPGGAVVRLIEEGPIGAWVVDGRPGEGLSAVRAHDAVVRRALRTGTPLPARFGTVFPGEEALLATLRERLDALAEALRRVEGAVEMGVRVGWNEREPGRVEAAGRGGRAYLEARRQEFEARDRLQERAEALLDEVEGALPEPLASVRRVLPEPGVAGSLAHLVHKEGVRFFRVAVEEARTSVPGAELRLSGPWAPYSFV